MSDGDRPISLSTSVLCWPRVGAGERSQWSTREKRNGSIGISWSPVTACASTSNRCRDRRCGLKTISRGDHGGGGHARCRQRRPPPRPRPFARPPRQSGVDGIVVAPPVLGAGRGDVGRPPGVADDGPQGLPLLVGDDGDRQPPIVARTRVDALGRGHRSPVAIPAQHRARRAVLGHLLSRRVQRRLDHHRLDQAATPGLIPLDEGQHGGDHRVHAGQRVARPPDQDRRAIGESGQPGHAGQALHGLGEPGPVPPRTVEAEGRHPHHDRSGLTSCRRSQPRPNCSITRGV